MVELNTTDKAQFPQILIPWGFNYQIGGGVWDGWGMSPSKFNYWSDDINDLPQYRIEPSSLIVESNLYNTNRLSDISGFVQINDVLASGIGVIRSMGLKMNYDMERSSTHTFKKVTNVVSLVNKTAEHDIDEKGFPNVQLNIYIRRV